MAAKEPGAYEFGAFRLDCSERSLSWGGRRVQLSGKGIDLLAALVRANGKPLSKQELMAEVWSDACVEENNLTVTMSAVRKALGEAPGQRCFIETLPRRGYRLATPAREIVEAERAGPVPLPGTAAARGALARREASHSVVLEQMDQLHEWQPAPILVGRELELDRLRDALGGALGHSGCVAFITGEAGSGKTALLDSFVHAAQRTVTALRVATGHCLEHFSASEAHAPFVEAIDGLLATAEGDAVAQVLQAHAPHWCLQFPGRFPDTEAFERVHRLAVGGTQRMLRELCQLLEKLSESIPILLRLEDLHWADSASVDALRLLCRVSKTQRLLVIGTFRVEGLQTQNPALHALYREVRAQALGVEVRLAGLSAQHIEGLLARTLGPHHLPADLAHLLWRRTEGQPLFVTRLIQHLIERGDLHRVSGAWHLSRDLQQLDRDVPESIRALIERKLDSLAAEERRTLQYASIEGEEFTSVVLASLLGTHETTLQERLRQLDQQHRLVSELCEETLTDSGFTVRYRFSHVLYQNLLYDELVSQRKRELHLAAAECLVQHYPHGAVQIAAHVARHFEQGGDFGRAVDYWSHCGDRAFRVCAYLESVQHLTHALTLLRQLRDSEPSPRLALVHQKRAWARIHLHNFHDAAVDLQRALAQARAVGDLQLEGETLNAICHVAVLHRHDVVVSDASAREALELTARSGDTGVGLVARMLMAGQAFLGGDSEAAEPALTELLVTARSLGHRPAVVLGLGFLGLLRFWRSEYELCDALMTEAVAQDVEFRDSAVTISALYVSGTARACLGRIDRAQVSFREALTWAQRTGDAARLPHVLGALCWLHRAIEQHDLAAEFARSAVEALRPEGNAYGVVGMHCNLLEADVNCIPSFGSEFPRPPPSEASTLSLRTLERALAPPAWWHWSFHLRAAASRSHHDLQCREFAAAEHGALRLLEAATSRHTLKYMAVAHRIIAEVRAEAGEWAAALAHARQGLGHFEEASAVLWAWKLLAGIGRLERRRGNAPAALRAYSRAWVMVRQIADSIGNEALRASFSSSPLVQEVRYGAGHAAPRLPER